MDVNFVVEFSHEVAEEEVLISIAGGIFMNVRREYLFLDGYLFGLVLFPRDKIVLQQCLEAIGNVL